MNTGQLLSILGQVPFFTKVNLGVALNKQGEDLNYWIKKLTREALLLPIRNGFYGSKPYLDSWKRDSEQTELYWLYIANTVRSPSYVSLEYVLSKYTIIPESTFAITSVTPKSSRVYRTTTMTFVYRSLKEDFFEIYGGYRLLALGNTGLSVRIAYPWKALFDFLYFQEFGSSTQMKRYVLDTGRLNWDALSSDEKNKFQNALIEANSKKMSQIQNILKRGGIL